MKIYKNECGTIIVDGEGGSLFVNGQIANEGCDVNFKNWQVVGFMMDRGGKFVLTPDMLQKVVGMVPPIVAGEDLRPGDMCEFKIVEGQVKAFKAKE